MLSLKTLKSSNCHLLCSSYSWLGAQSRLRKWWFAMRAAWARRPGNMQRRWKNPRRMLPRLLKKWRCLLQQGRFETPVGLRPGIWLTNPVNFAIISWLFCRLPVKVPKRLWKKPRRTQTHTCMMYTVYIHTYIHACIHTYWQTYIHPHTHTHIYTNAYAVVKEEPRITAAFVQSESHSTFLHPCQNMRDIS